MCHALPERCVVCPPRRLERFITIDNQHLLTEYAGGRNVILLAPHFIGLDIGGARLCLIPERNYVSMYRKAGDPLLEYLFLRRGDSAVL
jgi:KDO2-lipid IV(A) lauroyltransferase